MARFVLDIEGNSLIWQANVRQATRVNVDFDASIGKIINTEKVLNSLGIKTQRQIQQEVNTRQQLIKLLGKDQPQAVAILKSQLEQLSFQQQVTTNDNRQMQQAFFSLGFILDDSAQFQVGFSQGLRAISNNMIPLVSQVLRATNNIKFMGFAIIGTQLAMSALILLGPTIEKFFENMGKDAKDTAEELSDFAQAISGLVRLEGLDKLAEVTSEQLRVVKELAIAEREVAEGRVRFGKQQVELEEERLERLELARATTQEGRRIETEELRRRAEALEREEKVLEDLLDTEEGLGSLLDERVKKERALQLLLDLGIGVEEKKEKVSKVTLSTLQKLTREYDNLVDSLVEVGSAESRRIEDLRRANRSLKEQLELQTNLDSLLRGTVELFEGIVVPFDADNPIWDDVVIDDATEAVDKLVEQQRRLRTESDRTADRIEAANRRIAVSFTTGLADSIGSFAGTLAAGGDLVNAALIPLADMAIRVGKIAIATGIAIGGIREALRTLNPVVAIVAGAALVALGTAVKAALRGAAGGAGTGEAGRRAIFIGGQGSNFNVPAGRTSPLSGRVAGMGLATIGGNLALRVEVTGTLQSERGSFHAALETETLRSERLRSI